PCIYLDTEGEERAAIWGGPGIAAPRATVDSHRISVDCRYLPDRPRDGILSVYTRVEEQTEEFGESYALFDPDARLPRRPEGELLFTVPSSRLPPVEALRRFGSPEARAALGDPALADAYVRAWMCESPLYEDGAYAVLGGWHFPWPDGDWEA